MPDKKERDLWWVFLAGRPESEWNPPKKPKQPRPSRWQQRTQKRQWTSLQGAQEDISLPYDVDNLYGANAAPDIGAPLPHVFPSPAGQSNRPDIEAYGAYHQTLPVACDPPTGAASMIEDSIEVPLACSPREPTPTLLQHIDHVRHILWLTIAVASDINSRDMPYIC